MNKNTEKFSRVVDPPMEVDGLIARVVELEDGTLMVQQLEDEGWVESEATVGDRYFAAPLSPERLRRLGVQEE